MLSSPDNLEWSQTLRGTFGGAAKCRISDAAHRGISLAQLWRLREFMRSHCFKWHDRAPALESASSGVRLSETFVNLYHFNDWVIKPATKALEGADATCSMVELLADAQQTPQWFVSHWWGEPLEAFYRCLEAHAELRNHAVVSTAVQSR